MKIGKSLTPERRIAALQAGSPVDLKRLRLYPDPVDQPPCDLESHLHAAFSALRVRGEWFDLGRHLAQVDGAVASYYRKHDLTVPSRWER